MRPHDERYQLIATAARARVKSQEARNARRRVAKAYSENDPLNAEPDPKRRVLRMQAVTGLDADTAKRVVEGETPTDQLSGDERYGAERLLGATIDYLPVSFLPAGQTAASAVARVIFRTGSALGSGFLASGRLFLTNNHVIGSPDEARNLLLEFDYQTDPQGNRLPTTRFALDPDAFFVTNPKDDLDFTLIAVGKRVAGSKSLADFGFCRLSDSSDKHVLGEFVNIVQHPRGDLKQVVVRENKLVTRLENVLHYQADTEPGSSGSPVFNDEWAAVALHHWGEPHRERTTTEGQPLPRMVNEGIRISAIVKNLREATSLSDDAKKLLDEALTGDNPRPVPPQDGERREPGSGPQPEPARPPAVGGARVGAARVNPDGSVTLSLELRLNVIGAGGGEGGLGGPPDREEKLPPDFDYSTRKGYDPNFLSGFPLPFPKITEAAPGQKARLVSPPQGADPFELKYEHFSIVVNRTRRLPFVTAVNIDGQHLLKVDRKTGRVILGDNGHGEAAESSGGETWYTDKRLAGSDQTDQSLYDNQQPHFFDRGHQVRREDPNWGEAASAERANADTFHFTNCCPQQKDFNQKVKFWAGIENYVLDNARAERARVSVFTGPVFSPSDPKFHGVRVPKEFFKILARVEGGELLATAFVASQEELLGGMPERAEAFTDLGRVREYVTTVAEVEEMTGLDFGPLRDHDTFTPEALAARQPLASEEDLLAALGVSRSARAGRAPAAPARRQRAAEEAAPGFSAESLSATSFDWSTVLSSALACQLAYSPEAAIRSRVGEWGLRSCQVITGSDTLCVVAATADTTLVAFRGSANIPNWISNINVLYTSRPYGRVHRGFYFALDEIQARIRDAVSGLGKSRVLVTGHSLGGALAALYAAESADDQSPAWIYTFGQPRTGFGTDYVTSLTRRFAKRLVRVVNNNDVVPQVPPLPFRHAGRLVWFDATGNVGGDAESLVGTGPASDSPPPLDEKEFHELQQRMSEVAEGTRPETAAEGLLPSISDHYLEAYLDKITKQL